MDFMDAMDLKDLNGVEAGRMLPDSKLLFGSLGGTGMKGTLEARLLFGVAPSDHEMLFVIMNMF
jgi:hypothetical protein